MAQSHDAMIESDSLTIDSPTGASLNLYRTVPTEPRAVILVFHGLAEHAGRYRAFAEALAVEGFAVFAHDHRGHGSTTARDAPFRRFARHDGMDAVLRDCRYVLDYARGTYPDVPIFVFGHSMGGLVAMNFAQRHGDGLAGLAVWNSDLRGGWQTKAGLFGLGIEKFFKGSDVASMLSRRLVFEPWEKSIKNRRRDQDWLSHDPDAVDAFAEDPLCGFTPTVSMMEDVVAMVRMGGSKEAIARLPKGLPIHLLGGSEDPATEGGKALSWLKARLESQGLSKVTLTIVEGARHETFHETKAMREPAVRGFISWLNQQVG
ncbi:alpha/beta hydrolase [Fulvimarina sp. MAC3]|uniref:alpha/beta hydrolase n=1 Tax=Fulvimarina sp. MAC3 TaxID=3148887 RepID=UPI0031FCBD26